MDLNRPESSSLLVEGSEIKLEVSTVPKVSIIIVNYNTLHQLKRCLPSLQRLSYRNYEVIIVDNASIDGSADFVEQNFPQFRVIRSNENLGYTGGNNVGFKCASGEYIAVLNPDTKMEPDWLFRLVVALEANPNAGLACGKLLFMNDPAQINSCGLDITFTGLSFLRGLGEPAGRYGQPETVFGVAGSAFLIRRRVFEDLDGFDELLFTYYDDTDLSLRANITGYTCIYAPEAVGYHEYIFKFSERKCFIQERNRYYSLLTTLRVPTIILLLPTLFLSEVISWGFAILNGLKHVWGKLQSHIWLMRNWKQVYQARRNVQRLRKIPDWVLLSRFSWKIIFYNTTKSWLEKPLAYAFNPLIFVWGKICQAIVFW